MIEKRNDSDMPTVPTSPVGDLLQSEYHQVAGSSKNIFKSQSYDPISSNQRALFPQTRQSQVNEARDSPISSITNSITSKNRKKRTPSQPKLFASISSSVPPPEKLSPLDDPTFAPPPTLPQGVDLEKARAVSRHRKSSSMPSFDKITHSGHMLARTSLKSIITRRWRSVFWVAYENSKILIFRSKSDFEEWVTNPYLNALAREKMVKQSFDFEMSHQHAGIRCFRTYAMQEKKYNKTGLVHTFKLEQWMHYGPIILGAFASRSQSEIGAFNVICKEMIKKHKSGVKDYLMKSESVEEIDALSHRSSYTVKSAPNIRYSGFQ